jgi:2-oxoglutarate ferredoxin oxidoreductase subunit alpha
MIRALKSMGFYLHSEREYPSLIKGGHSMAQIDFGPEMIYSRSNEIDILLAIDSPGLIEYIETVKEGGTVIHTFERHERVPKIAKVAEEKKLNMIFIPARQIALDLAHTDLVANIVLAGFVWKVFKFDLKYLEEEVKRQFASKPKLLEIDLKCIEAGYALESETPIPEIVTEKPETAPDMLLLDGNEALSLGAVQCGVRALYSYPMTPASSILTYMANMANDAGLLVKQAEDEITSAQMALGSMHMGTRALVATSGGGYDLMTETVSLAGVAELPFVLVLAQRPGPATGIPTWTAQADLNMAIYSSHGEFPRLVVAASDAESCYELIQHAFNYAEKFQMVVVFMTEKIVAEAKYMAKPFEHGAIPIERALVTEQEELDKLLSSDRYKITDDGLSKRWIPGSAKAHYYVNSDEHLENGVLTEDGDAATAMMDKRMRKVDTLLAALPEPEVFGDEAGAEISFIGWGSTKNLMRDTIAEAERQGRKINYLHFTYIYPLKTERLEQFFKDNPNVCLIEGNYQGQLGQLIEQNTDLKFKQKFLRYNGRPFHMEEVLDFTL